MADIKIAGTLHNSEDIQGDPLHSHVVARADEILDEAKGKKQSVLNQQTEAKLDTHETRLNGYTQGKFVTVSTREELVPGIAATDTIYRVSNYDGSANSGQGAVDVTKYSEYAWDGTRYVFLCVKTQIGEVFDISEYNAGAVYDDLADALSNNHVPAAVRKPGMSVKFLEEVTPASYTVVKTEEPDAPQTGTELSVDPGVDSGTYDEDQLGAFSTLPASTGAGNAVTYWMEVAGDPTTYTKWVITMAHTSDDKYVQYFLTKDEWSTNEGDWEKINLEEEVGQLGQYLYKRYNAKNIKNYYYQNYSTGAFVESNNFFVVEGIPVKGYEKIDIARTVNVSDNAMGIVFYASDGATKLGGFALNASELNTIIVPANSVYASLTIAKNVYEETKQIMFHAYPIYNSESLHELIDTKIVQGIDTDFMELDSNFNLFMAINAKVGYYINGTNGNEVANGSFVASPFIPVKPSTKYYIQGGNVVLATYYAFYDANKNYVSGENATTGYLSTLTAPNNAYFVRFTGFASNYQNIIFSENPSSPIAYKYTPKDNVVIYVSVSATDLTDITLQNAGNIIDRSKLIVGAYIDPTDGKQKSTSSTWVATDWCDIDANKKYSWFKIQDFYAAFYDKDKAFILGYPVNNRMSNPVTPPSNAKYARFSILNDGANVYGVYPIQDCWVGADCENRQPNEYKSYVFPKEIFTEREYGINPCDYTGKEISVFNKILCVGDSLMYGGENVAIGSPYIGDKEPLYNIPTYIKKMTGVETTNAAHSGYNAAQWLEEYSQQDLSGHDAVIIQIGVNDWRLWSGDSDPSINSFKTTLGQIIDLVIEQNSYNNSGTLKNKPKVFVATQFPAKSYLGTDSNPISVLNNAITDVVDNRSDCFLLDMAEYSHSNDNIAFNRGHLTALGYRQVAQDYIGIISKFVNDNLDLFVDVPFVGTPATQYEYSPTQK